MSHIHNETHGSVCALDAQVSLGFAPASPVAFLCIPMAGPTKRLRRKTTVFESSNSELLLVTSEWWMQFAFLLGRYMLFDHSANWRLLSKAWREVWDQGLRITLSLHHERVFHIRLAAQSQGDLLFHRDSDNKILYYHHIDHEEEGLYCTVSMPWNTFKRLRPMLLRIAKHGKRSVHDAPKAFCVFSFVQTAFNVQSEL